jgi:hypothetical protein
MTSKYAQESREGMEAGREQMEAKGAKFWTMPVGNNFPRVLPPHDNMVDADGRPRFFHPICLHFQVGPAKRTVPCPRRMLGQVCPVCEYAFALRDQGQEKAGNALLPSWQAYMNVLIFDAEGEPIRNKAGDIELQVWSASGGPKGVLGKIFDEIEEREQEDGKIIRISDPEEGYTLKVKRVGTKKEDTTYTPKLSKRATSIINWEEYWADDRLDLTVRTPMLNADALRSLLTGTEDDAFGAKAVAELPKGKLANDFDDDDDDVAVGEFTELPAADEETTTAGEPSAAAERLRKMVDGKKKGK